jgi:hypothetical protein
MSNIMRFFRIGAGAEGAAEGAMITTIGDGIGAGEIGAGIAIIQELSAVAAFVW